ncbi:7799_t:CDS:2 [Funneliformis geosporum]|uniref:9824_t:CDS:1 n=1 Tax=Funneliformis geosporum TaxID=1117311 RepID=A0A9W4WSX5_9GLOM|nr:7799_t:CDS:2 [Funneliformis geosporum]CAI2176306.1 9824_t:CDS:2 [Funneliformis geosporum]
MDTNNNTFKRPQSKLQVPLQPAQLNKTSINHNHHIFAKRRLYNSLNNQLSRLQRNMTNLEENVELTTSQLKNIQSFGLAHGAIFMAANRIMRNDNS